MANLLLLGAGTLAVGGLGYLGYRWWEDQQRAIAEERSADRPAGWDGILPAGYTPPLSPAPAPPSPFPADPLGILSTLGGLAGSVPGLIPGFPGSEYIPPIPVYGSAGMLAPVSSSDATVTVPNGGSILVGARTTAPELTNDFALALALTALYREQAPNLLGYVGFVAAPQQLPPAVATYVDSLLSGVPGGLPIAPPLAGARLFMGTLNAQPTGPQSATFARVARSTVSNVESTILATRRP